MTAPATAPTGPNTTAPETAPSAALPARSWALASNEKNVPAISYRNKRSVHRDVLEPSAGTGLRNCGGTKEMWRQRLPEFKKPAAGFPARAQIAAMMKICR